jgi:hypothetical protein
MSGPGIPLPSATDIATLAAALDAATESERIAWLAGLPRSELGVLYERSEGRAIALPAVHAAEGEPVIHEGINSAPSFRRFQKRMVLHDGQVKGHNHQPWAWLVGDGTFVVRPSPEREGELWFDYTGLPESAFPGFPPPRANTAGLSRFVYGDMIDVVRQVSAHVCIGKAFKRGDFAGFYFALCRTGG